MVRFAGTYSPNNPVSYAQHSGKLCCWNVARNDFLYLFRGKCRKSISVPDRGTVFLLGILHINGATSSEQMIGVATAGIVALVADVDAFWDWPMN